MLVDFWTYSCINCLRAIPYVRAWAEKYKDQGLVVIGVHSPEFAFEKNIDNVRRAVRDLKVEYPVAIDNAYAIWRAFGNQYWPAHYFIDAEGRIRHHHFGEGDYEESEAAIRALLAETGKTEMAGGYVNVAATGVEAAGDLIAVQSPETYVGYERTENFASPGGTVRDMRHAYATPSIAAEKSMGAGRRLDGGERKGRARWSERAHRVPLPRPRPASRARPRTGRQAGAIPRVDRRRARRAPTTAPTPTPTATGSSTSSASISSSGKARARRTAPSTIEFLDPGAEAFAFTFG